MRCICIYIYTHLSIYDIHHLIRSAGAQRFFVQGVAAGLLAGVDTVRALVLRQRCMPFLRGRECVYVFVYVYVRVCICICICICICVCVHCVCTTYTFTCMSTCIYVYMCVYVYVNVFM